MTERIGFCVVAICFSFFYDANAQTVAGGVAAKGMDMHVHRLGGVVQEVDYSEKSVKGSAYLFDNHRTCRIFTNGTEYKVLLNFNIEKRQYEIRENGRLRILPMGTIEKFIDEEATVYQPFRDYKMASGVPLEGIVKVNTANKKVNLLTHYIAYIKESNYVMAMDVGDKSDEVKKREHYYLLVGDVAYPVLSNRRKLAASLPYSNEVKKQIEQYIKTEKLSLRSLGGAFQLAQYLDSI